MSALTLSTRTCVKIALPVLNGRHQVPGPFTCLFMSPELFFCFNEGWWPPQRNSCSNHSGSKWTRNQPSHPPNTLQQTFRGLGADSKSVPGPVVGYLPSPGSQWTGRRAFTRSGESLMVRTGVRLTFHSGRGTIYIWVGSCWTIPGEIHGQITTGLETAWSILQGIPGESHAARVIFMC